MKRNWELEVRKRVKWIRDILQTSHTDGIVFGNSGGKDCAVVGALCRRATKNVIGVIMPCQSKINYTQNKEHAELLANKFDIKTMCVDLTPTYDLLKEQIDKALGEVLQSISAANIKPRLRMTTLYAIAQNHNYLVAGTGNRSEITMGYFTKWGDGAYDFNPIGDLTVTEVYELADYLLIPEEITSKKPSADLWEGQTDEDELGISYAEIDNCLLNGEGSESSKNKVMAAFMKTGHKRDIPKIYG